MYFYKNGDYYCYIIFSLQLKVLAMEESCRYKPFKPVSFIYISVIIQHTIKLFF